MTSVALGLDTLNEVTEDDESRELTTTHKRKPSRKHMAGCYDMIIGRCTTDQRDSVCSGPYDVESKKEEADLGNTGLGLSLV